jgi:hypothetical protein
LLVGKRAESTKRIFPVEDRVHTAGTVAAASFCVFRLLWTKKRGRAAKIVERTENDEEKKEFLVWTCEC